MVNIAWDSAGVTTGPITVPLVIAMGLGIGSMSQVVEGFGLLALASVGPILVVLSIGLIIQASQNNGSRLISRKIGSAFKNKKAKQKDSEPPPIERAS
ncbi:MAG: DUF1538 family protein [Pseudobacteriovorax sp.]|nr:DUF1538 family protein [Pseudobacteriovorax sp.]